MSDPEQLAYTMGTTMAGESETDLFLATVILQSYLAGIDYEPEDVVKLAKEFKRLIRQGTPD